MSATDRYPVDKRHFDVLRRFRSHGQTRVLEGKNKDLAWRGVLQGGKLAYVPIPAVEAAYREFLKGESSKSALRASTDEVLQGAVRMQITYGGRIVGAHVSPVESVMENLMPTFRRSFDSEEEALARLLEIFQPPRRKRKNND